MHRALFPMMEKIQKLTLVNKHLYYQKQRLNKKTQKSRISTKYEIVSEKWNV